MDEFDVYTREFGLVVVGAVIFIASLLWRDFMKDLENLLFPNHDGYSLIFRFLYVVIITFVLVFVAIKLKMLFGIYTDENPNSHLNQKDEKTIKALQE